MSLCARSHIFQRQIERESRTGARQAAEMDFATKQARKLATDGKAEAGAAVFPAGRGIGLLERFEDELLLFRRNADAGVGDFERDDAGSLTKHRMVDAPAAQRHR